MVVDGVLVKKRRTFCSTEEREHACYLTRSRAKKTRELSGGEERYAMVARPPT